MSNLKRTLLQFNYLLPYVLLLSEQSDSMKMRQIKKIFTLTSIRVIWNIIPDYTKGSAVLKRTLSKTIQFSEPYYNNITKRIIKTPKLYPVEVKKTATPSLIDTKSFDVLKSLKKETGEGAVICLRESVIPISDSVPAVPVWEV